MFRIINLSALLLLGDHVAKSSLVFTDPPEVVKAFDYKDDNGRIEVNYSDFGVIPYGKSIVSKVIVYCTFAYLWRVDLWIILFKI